MCIEWWLILNIPFFLIDIPIRPITIIQISQNLFRIEVKWVNIFSYLSCSISLNATTN